MRSAFMGRAVDALNPILRFFLADQCIEVATEVFVKPVMPGVEVHGLHRQEMLLAILLRIDLVQVVKARCPA